MRLHLSICAPDLEHQTLPSLVGGLWRSPAGLHAAAHVDDAWHFRALSSTVDLEAFNCSGRQAPADPGYWLDPVRQHSRWNGFRPRNCWSGMTGL